MEIHSSLRGYGEHKRAKCYLLPKVLHESTVRAKSDSGKRSSSLLKPASLLQSVQQTITDGSVRADTVCKADESLLIHRCHDLSRQAEVIHDALLHSLKQRKDLAPHDILIVSPGFLN